MSRRRDEAKRAKRIGGATDPTTVPGAIVGPLDDPYARDAVVVDMRNAVLLETTAACVVAVERQGKPDGEAVALSLSGRVNQRTDVAEVLFLTDAEGAAALVAELIGVMGRSGHAGQFTAALDRALEAMPT